MVLTLECSSRVPGPTAECAPTGSRVAGPAEFGDVIGAAVASGIVSPGGNRPDRNGGRDRLDRGGAASPRVRLPPPQRLRPYRPSVSPVCVARLCRPSVSPVWPFGWLLALARPGQGNEVPLGAHESFNWARKESRRWESNPRPDDYKWPIPFRAEAHLVPGRIIFPA